MMILRGSLSHNADGQLKMLRHAAWAISLILLITLSSPAQESPAHSSKPQPGNSGTPFRNTARGVHYVGSQTCRQCHFAIYDKFSHTDMGRSTSLPSKILDWGWLSQKVDLFNEKYNRHYEVFSRDSKVYQSEYGLDAEGKEIFRHTEELEFVVGTGANGATPIVRRGNYLFQAPLSYYAAKKAWDLSPNYEVHDLGFSLPITADCIGCHTGKTQPVKGREGLYEDPPISELAVSCERCHGPGELHVRERLAGAPVSGKVDRSIVNPAKLPPWLADNICMSCHEGDIRSLQPGKSEGDFRPGTALNDTVLILKAPIDLRDTQSPLLEHYYSMTLSKCYRGSAGKLGCQSCHDPHLQPPQEETAEYFRSRCLQCHAEKSCSFDLQKRLAQSPVDACSSCHMPRQPALTVSHSILTDHRITRTQDEPYPEIAFKTTLPDTGFIHVNAVPGKTDRIPAVALLRAYRQELIRSHLEFKPYYFRLLDELSKEGSKDPFVLSSLAQKASSDGETSKAIAYARQVIDQGSTSAYDYLLLDRLLVSSGNLAGSIDVLKRGITIAPYNNFLYESLAVRELSSGDPAAALATIKRGLELYPEDSVLRNLQDQADANTLTR